MNDVTLRQIAAAKPMVNNGSAIWTYDHMWRSSGDVFLYKVDLRTPDDFD
jgi:hypothetical protein